MLLGAAIGISMFIASCCINVSKVAIERKDRAAQVIYLITALALFIIAGMALACP